MKRNLKIPNGLPNLDQPESLPVDLIVFMNGNRGIEFQKLSVGDTSMYLGELSVKIKKIALEEACKHNHNVEFYYSTRVSEANLRNNGDFEHFTLEGTGEFGDAVIGKPYKENLYWYVKFTPKS